MTTTAASPAELVEALRLHVRACNHGTECSEARTACVAGVHLFPKSLSATAYPMYQTPSGSSVHTDPACGSLRSSATPVAYTWSQARHRLCRNCGTTPAAVTATVPEARKVASALGVVVAATRHWPGRLPAGTVAQVQEAAAKLAKAKVTQLRTEVELGRDVAALLVADTDGWTPPPVPDSVLGAAVADLVGVDDDPFFRSGQRPRTPADRIAAEVASTDQLAHLWTEWHRLVTATGEVNYLELPGLSGLDRPARRAAMTALWTAWTSAGRALATEGDPQVVAIPTDTHRLPRTEPLRSRVASLLPLAVLNVPQAGVCLVVVPAAVARWLSRSALSPFEHIGPWPGDTLGVPTLEALVRLVDGDLGRMPELLPIACDLVADPVTAV